MNTFRGQLVPYTRSGELLQCSINVWAPQIEPSVDRAPDKMDADREIAALVLRV